MAPLPASLGTTWYDWLLDLWVVALRELAPGRDASTRFAALGATLVDTCWFVLGLFLAPFFDTKPGRVERRCFARAMHLDPPQHKTELRQVDTATVGNGDVLRAHLWLPAGVPGPFPTVLIRNPYGGGDRLEWGQGVLAERGFAVLLQDTRGRFGSDGEFVPVEHEREDGAATVRWLREQPWCNGRIGVLGVSYLGLTAWACVGACEAGELQAAVVTSATTRIYPIIFPEGGAVSLELLNLWLTLVYRWLLKSRAECWAAVRGALAEWASLRPGDG
jgi:hypothetical protein